LATLSKDVLLTLNDYLMTLQTDFVICSTYYASNVEPF